MTTRPQIIESITVPALSEKIRLQDAAPMLFKKIATKSGLKKAIKNKRVKIQGTVLQTGTYLYGGETIDLFENPLEQSKPVLDIPLDVLYEDTYFAVVHKPAGITVSGNKKWTLENALRHNLTPSTATDALVRPEPIHRLDHPTSGALLIGKTAEMVITLNKLFEEKQIEKTYMAVTQGICAMEGTIQTPIDLKQASTVFYKRASIPSPKYTVLNLTELHPATGRKHQLRKHLSEMKTPILGDKTYGIPGNILFGNGLYLHAYQLNFVHPITQKSIAVRATLPKKFSKLFPEQCELINKNV